jgi:hypothetical protein
MPLSYLVERILALRNTSNVPLAYMRMNQTIQALAASQRLPHVGTRANEDNYANIIYRMKFGNAMVPSNITANIKCGGNEYFNGLVTAGIIAQELDFLIVAKRPDKLDVDVVNNVPLAQYYELNVYYLAILSEDDYKIIMDYINMRR